MRLVFISFKKMFFFFWSNFELTQLKQIIENFLIF